MHRGSRTISHLLLERAPKVLHSLLLVCVLIEGADVLR